MSMYLSMTRYKGAPLEEAVRECCKHYQEHYQAEADTVLVSARMVDPPVEVGGLPVVTMRWITPGSVAVAALGETTHPTSPLPPPRPSPDGGKQP